MKRYFLEVTAKLPITLIPKSPRHRRALEIEFNRKFNKFVKSAAGQRAAAAYFAKLAKFCEVQ